MGRDAENDAERGGRERAEGRRELSRRGIAFGTVISVLAVLGGAVAGAIVTLGIVVLQARFGTYVFALEELAALRLETLPVVLGMAAGVTVAILHPRALDRAVVFGVAGLLLGVVAGILLGGLLWGAGEGPWAGGIVFGAAGLLFGAVFSVFRHPEPGTHRPLLAGGLGSVLLLAAALFLTIGAARMITDEPLDLPDFEGVPVPEPADVESVVFLVGDAGASAERYSPLLAALGADVERWSAMLARDSAVSVLYLGDIIYPVGLHDRGHPSFPTDSARLWSQIGLVAGEAAQAHESLGLFLAGNHDWGNTGGPEALARLRNLGAELDRARATGPHVDLLPPAGEPGPATVDVPGGVRLVLVDTHWFLQRRPAEERAEFYERLERILEDAGDRTVVLAAHHPYRSAGPHGTIVPGYDATGIALLLRKSGTIIQDLNSRVYAELLTRTRAAFEGTGGPPLVFAGGHDHSLQVLEGGDDADPRFSLVSGSGSKLSGISDVPGLVWGAARPGYMMLAFRSDGGVDLFVVAGAPEAQACDVPPEQLEACRTDGAETFDIAYSSRLRPPVGSIASADDSRPASAPPAFQESPAE